MGIGFHLHTWTPAKETPPTSWLACVYHTSNKCTLGKGRGGVECVACEHTIYWAQTARLQRDAFLRRLHSKRNALWTGNLLAGLCRPCVAHILHTALFRQMRYGVVFNWPTELPNVPAWWRVLMRHSACSSALGCGHCCRLPNANGTS